MTEIRKIEGTLTGKNYKPGLCFAFTLSIPKAPTEEYALLVEHDGENAANVASMLRLADEGKAPYCVSIGVAPGKLPMPDGTVRDMRMNSYDLFDREYADFVVYELIPYVSETYSLRFAASPDMHFVSGASSGGISAFALAWFHPNYFRRLYMSSPTFLALGRGNEIPYLIRKYETKPIRICGEYSEREPNEYFGWSRPIDEESSGALEFAGYDFRYSYFPDEGHISRYRNEEQAYLRNEWIWRGWQTESITAPRNSPRVDRVIPPGSWWERCDSFPAQEERAVPAVLAGKFDHVVESSDGQAFYAACRTEDIVYMFVNDENLSPQRGLLHAALHTILRFEPKGPVQMAVDRADRLFVLTAIGIQCVRSYGLIDVILALPDDSAPLEIAVADALYVRTEQGIYKRPLTEDSLVPGPERRKFVHYYD